MIFPEPTMKMIFKRQTVWILLLMVCSLNAQEFELKDYPVSEDGIQKTDPYTGGFNNPQLLEIDFNLDGTDDLVVFDRDGDIFLPFQFVGSAGNAVYAYRPEYKNIFPPIEHWIVARDANSDGIVDLFVSSQVAAPGIQLYLGRDDGGKLSYDLLEFDQDYIFNVLSYRVNNNTSNLDVTDIDIPAITDIDADGDLDVLTFQRGNGNVLFYRNMQTEEGLPIERMIFELEDNCWGGFFEDASSDMINLAPNPGDCAFNAAGGDSRMHAGSTLQVFDPDRDGVSDIIIGDLTSSNVSFLLNTGTTELAHMTEIDVQFPAYDEPVDLPSFVSTFYLDVDHDGDSDLLFTPNLQSPEAIAKDQIRFYRNIGINRDTFELFDASFLSPNTLDLGLKSCPSIIDLNGDGLLDLLIGIEWDRADSRSTGRSMYSILNVGTPTEPSFIVDNEDFGGFSSFLEESVAFAPAWGDIDNDGDQDLVVGDKQGKLFLAENVGGPGNPVIISGVEYEWMGIDVGQYATPELVDLDGDGDLDLLVGERNGNNDENGRCGNINYFENIGTAEEPMFSGEPDDPCYGRILTVDSFQLFGYSAPVLYRGAEGDLLMTGSYLGSIRRYEVGDVGNAFSLINGEVGGIREGITTVFDLGDLDGDGLLEIVCGNARGGLAIYGTNLTVGGVTPVDDPTPVGTSFEIYPNPSSSNNTLMLKVDGSLTSGELVIYGATGMIVHRQKLQPQAIQALRPNLGTGIYFVALNTNSGRLVKKLVVR